MKTEETPLDRLLARNDRYKARADALTKLVQRERIYWGALNLASLIVAGVATILLWENPSIRFAIGLICVFFLLRWIATFLLYRLWTLPNQARIRRDFPPPEDLQ